MALVGECIALWTEVELQAAVVLGAMLKTSSQPAAALYFTLANERAKREAMAAIATHVLPARERDIVSAWLLLKKSIEKDRVDLAHGLFGISEADDEGIAWVSTNHRIKNIVDMMQCDNDPVKLHLLMNDLRKYVFIYTLKYLETIKFNIINLHEISYKLVALVANANNEAKDGLHLWLSQSPLLRKFLSPTSSNPRGGPSETEQPPFVDDQSVSD